MFRFPNNGPGTNFRVLPCRRCDHGGAGAKAVTGAMTIRTLLMVALAVLAAGCSYRGPTDDIVSQRLTWFSYLNGDDIRRLCFSGAPERYRLVYNGDFDIQARGYDYVETSGGGGVLNQVVDRGITFGGGQPVDFTRVGAPIRASMPIGADGAARLKALMRASGVFDPPPVGLRLNSRGHYWIVSGCHDGRFFLTGYRYPSDRYDGLRFVAFLQAADRTGVRYPTLPAPGRARFQARCRPNTEQTVNSQTCFWQEIGPDGLVGIATAD